MYVRKTRDEWVIESDHGYGWDTETTVDTWREAREELKVYRANVNVPIRARKVRVRIEASDASV